MAGVKLNNIYKSYGKNEVIRNVELDIKDGEFMVLVGPSGCGKTTVLRMVAGLEEITSGELYIGNKLANDLPSKDRKIAMVFQSYALFPHMNLNTNVGFGLKIKKVSHEEIMQRVDWALDLVDLTGLGERIPRELSGGQRQRVALARALVMKPEVLLLDEPLSNLDAKLRLKMRTELKRIHKRIKSTTIYVTHDQAEAMTLGDRVAILNKGDIVQVGSPTEVYDSPQSKFVAGFIGSPPMNFVNGTIKDGKLEYEGGSYLLPDELARKVHKNEKISEVTLGVRPENIRLSMKKEARAIEGKTSIIQTLGSDNFVAIEIGRENIFLVRVSPKEDIPLDSDAWLVLDMDRVHLFDQESGERLIE